MESTSAEETVYRFAAIGARGEVTLREDSVHVKTRTYRGSWEQTVPLECLSPIYGTLTTSPLIYHMGWVFAVVFVFVGGYIFVTSALAVVRIVAGVFVLFLGLWHMGYLWQHRRTEWIMFPGHAHGLGCRVCYTREGPDAEFCDEFTRRMVTAISHCRRQHRVS